MDKCISYPRLVKVGDVEILDYGGIYIPVNSKVGDASIFIKTRNRINDLDALVAEHVSELSRNPDDHGTRYMLASCLNAKGEKDAAKNELEHIILSGDKDWNILAQNFLNELA